MANCMESTSLAFSRLVRVWLYSLILKSIMVADRLAHLGMLLSAVKISMNCHFLLCCHVRLLWLVVQFSDLLIFTG